MRWQFRFSGREILRENIRIEVDGFNLGVGADLHSNKINICLYQILIVLPKKNSDDIGLSLSQIGVGASQGHPRP